MRKATGLFIELFAVLAAVYFLVAVYEGAEPHFLIFGSAFVLLLLSFGFVVLLRAPSRLRKVSGCLAMISFGVMVGCLVPFVLLQP
jgi:hypothetical protein